MNITAAGTDRILIDRSTVGGDAMNLLVKYRDIDGNLHTFNVNEADKPLTEAAEAWNLTLVRRDQTLVGIEIL